MYPKYEYRNAAIYVSDKENLRECPARFHKQLEAMYVRNTQVQVSINGENYTLCPGDVYVAFPNVLHSNRAISGSAVVVIVDDTVCPAYHDILIHKVPVCPVLRAGQVPQTVYALFERMIALRKSKHPFRQSVLAGYANALVGELAGLMELTDRNFDENLVQQLIMYMLNNYTREITLEDVARDLNYSKYYISRVISNTFHCNFRFLINSYRVSMAQNLLVASDKSISDIAFACGFTNQSSFNRVFLQFSEDTPSQFRRKTGSPPEKPALYVR